MRLAPMLARLFAGASVALLATILPQAGIAEAASIPSMSTSCNSAGTASPCAQQDPGSGRFDVSLTGPSGTRKLFGVCPASSPQTIDLQPPFTVASYDNRSQCQIALVDNQGTHHPVPFGNGAFHPGLVATQAVIYPVNFAGRP
jgi:hypothetical protein